MQDISQATPRTWNSIQIRNSLKSPPRSLLKQLYVWGHSDKPVQFQNPVITPVAQGKKKKAFPVNEKEGYRSESIVNG